MHVLNMAHEVALSRDMARRTITISLILHLALFGWLMLRRHLDPVSGGIVEITWLEPVAPAPEPAPAPARIEKAVPQTRKADPKPETKFLRREEVAQVEPTPQDLTANRDKVQDRLAALRKTRPAGLAVNAAGTVSSSLLKSAAAAPTSNSQTSAPVDLKRAESSTSKPMDLTRGPVTKSRPVPVAATVPREKPAAAVTDLSSVSKRTLDGADLVGEVADRPIDFYLMPDYPEWATDQAVEGTVTLYFVVLPDGGIKENVQVQKTAGFMDFDQNAVKALLKWRFQPLSGGKSVEQWGTITFRYRLRD